jgi:hypothetical protein
LPRQADERCRQLGQQATSRSMPAYTGQGGVVQQPVRALPGVQCMRWHSYLQLSRTTHPTTVSVHGSATPLLPSRATAEACNHYMGKRCHCVEVRWDVSKLKVWVHPIRLTSPRIGLVPAYEQAKGSSASAAMPRWGTLMENKDFSIPTATETVAGAQSLNGKSLSLVAILSYRASCAGT